MSATSTALDEAIRVVVTPSQASYFAGEPFSVTITITNTRSPESLTPKSASHSISHLHRRGAHSISSVPLARPPTSPGIRTAVPFRPKEAFNLEETTRRKGLIGRGAPSTNGQDGDSLNVEGSSRRPPVLTKSLSVSIAPGEIPTEFREDVKGKTPVRNLRTQESAFSCEFHVLWYTTSADPV